MIRYSNGAIVNTLYTSDGTKSQMISQITAALVTAGWTLVSGAIYESATTPQGFKIRVDVIDGGICVHVRLRDGTTPNTGLHDGAFLFPVVGRVFRIIANKYQCFHFFSGTTFTLDPCDVAFGVLYTPPFLSPINGITPSPYYGWMVCNGVGNPGDPANGSNQGCFHGNFPIWSTDFASMWIWDGARFYDSGGGAITYIIGQTSRLDLADVSGLWEGGAISVYEPYLGFPTGHGPAGSWATIMRRGQIWDAFVLGTALTSEATLTFDDRQWMTLGNTLSTRIPHSVMLLMP